jgi:hypothetical protein
MIHMLQVLTFVSPPSLDDLRDRGLVKTQSSLLPLVEICNLPPSFLLTVCIDEEDAVILGENVAEDVEDRGRVPDVDGPSVACSVVGRGGGGTYRFSSFL